MSAPQQTAPGGAAAADTGPLWLSVSELADRHGITPAAVSQRIATLSGRVATKRVGGKRLVNVAQFASAVAEVSDLGRTTAAAYKRSPAEETYTAAQARKAAVQADLVALELAERRGSLVSARDVEQASVQCANVILSAISRLPAMAEDIYTVGLQDGGPPAVRKFLRVFVRGLRRQIAAEFSRLAAAGQRDTEAIAAQPGATEFDDDDEQ
jgi:hypothetical protein